MRSGGGLASARMGCPHSRQGGGRGTRESKMMEERNAVVSAATMRIMETGVELGEPQAYAMAQDGFVRRLDT